jgi:dipeptidyl aminopeptidase/acylaminoacyl peptidase
MTSNPLNGRQVVLAMLLTLGFTCLPAQIQPWARYQGKLLPMLNFNNDRYIVIDNGHRETASEGGIELRPGTEFAPGLAEITQVQSDYDPLKGASPQRRADPGSVRFRYEAQIGSTSKLKNCYGMLTFVTNGSVGTHFIGIGTLNPGHTRQIKIELTQRVDSVGHLHIFADGLELKTSQTPAAYDAKEYFSQLAKGSKGISAVALCKSEEFLPHVLSDDGNRLATVRHRDTHDSLIIYELNPARLVWDIKLGDQGETAWSLTWISDHELAYVTNENPQGTLTSLMLLELKTGKSVKLEPNVSRIVGSPKNRRDTLMVFGRRWQYKTGTALYNVRTRKLGPVTALDEGTTYYDDNGEQRVRYEYDGNRIRLFYRLANKSSWRDLDDDVKEPGLRFALDSSNVLDRVCQLHSIGSDGDTLYLSTRQHSDCFELATFSLTRGIITRVIASNPNYDLGDEANGETRLLFRKGSQEVIGLIYEGEKPQTVWMDPAYAAVQRVIDKALPDHINRPIDWSVEGNTFIYFSSNDHDPGTFYLFRPHDAVLMPLMVLGEEFKNQPLGRTSAFDFPARDGVPIHAYLTRPPDNSMTKPVPLIVVVHGGPDTRDIWGFGATNQFLATRGYDVLQVNYRGSSGYGAAYQKAGLYARFDTVILDDIADGVRHLIGTGEVDPHRIAIMGGSFGGWATYMSLIKYPELFRSGVAIAAVSHWRSLIKDTGRRDEGDYAAAYWKSLLEHSDFEKTEPFIDPYLRAKEIKRPIYVMHGESDWVVRPTETKLMLEALKKAQAQVESMSFPNTGHSDWPYAARVTMLNEIDGFFQRTLSPVGSNATP